MFPLSRIAPFRILTNCSLQTSLQQRSPLPYPMFPIQHNNGLSRWMVLIQTRRLLPHLLPLRVMLVVEHDKVYGLCLTCHVVWFNVMIEWTIVAVMIFLSDLVTNMGAVVGCAIMASRYMAATLLMSVGVAGAHA